MSRPRAPTISQVVDQEVVEGDARQKNAIAQIIAAEMSYSPTGIARQIIEKATRNQAPSLRDPIWWTYGGRTLAELARTTALDQAVDVR